MKILNKFNLITILISILFLGYSCQTKESKNSIKIDHQKEDSLRKVNYRISNYTIYAEAYRYDSLFVDSILVNQRWFLGDSILLNVGDTALDLPFKSQYLDEFEIQEEYPIEAFTDTIEEFDSLICETGGSAAWNKYIIHSDFEKGNLQTIYHYTSNRQVYDKYGKIHIRDKPEYKLNHIIIFDFIKRKTTRTVYDSDKNILEIIKKNIIKGQTKFQEISTTNDQFYRVYFKHRIKPNI